MRDVPATLLARPLAPRGDNLVDVELGAHPQEIPTVEGGIALNPIVQGQRQVDDEVDGVNRSVEKPVLGQRSPVCGPLGEEPAKRGLFRGVLVDVAVFFNGRAG